MNHKPSLSIAALLVCLLSLPSREAAAQDTTEFFALSDLTLDPEAATTVINARKVDPRLYAASFFPRNLQCTSSLVGPRVLLTAAHCVTAGGSVSVTINNVAHKAVCDHEPSYHPRKNRTADYALCLFASDINDTPYFETINVDPSKLRVGQEILLTGFGCTGAGGGGDTSGNVYRVGEASITDLPTSTDNFIVTKGRVAVCHGDSGGPGYVQRRGDDGGPRLQVSVNAVGNIRDISGLSSLSTPTAVRFLKDWSTKNNVAICGLHAAATKCHLTPQLR